MLVICILNKKTPLLFLLDGSDAREKQNVVNTFGQYRMKAIQKSKADPNIEQLLKLMSFGRCIPSSCSEDDLKNGLENFFIETGYSTLKPIIYNCHTEDEEQEIEAADWVMISIIIAFAILITIGTIVDLSIKYLNADIFNERFVQVFQGFSWYTNTVKLFTTDNIRPDSLSCINGIRFLSMTWVLFSHSYSQIQGMPLKNLFGMFDSDGPVYGNLAFAAITNGYVSVDSFFFIGSTLLAYLTMQQLEKLKGGNLQFWLMYYIHRYIRLTAVYSIMIGIWATLLRFLATGPYSSFIETESSSCKEAWWSNMLYINNILPQIEKNQETNTPWCLGQTWYLANDMQYFLISPIFLVAFWYKPILGWAVSLLGLLLGTIAPMIVTYKNDFPFSPSFMVASDGFDYMIDFYIVPWCRFQPYIMGLMLGYILHRMRDQAKLKMNVYFVIWIWAIAGVVGAEVVYSMYPFNREYVLKASNVQVGTMAERVAYAGLHRAAWSLCLGWVILACTKGVGGPINSILSWPLWVPLARLSYCIYLCHMTVMSYASSTMTFTVYFSHTFGVYFCLAMLCLSIFIAYLLSMTFEIPMAHMEKIFFASIGIGKFPKAFKPPSDYIQNK